MERSQINLRVSEELGRAIDAKRIELSHKLGRIPSRSDVVRLALEKYLQIDLSASEVDRRRATAKPPGRVRGGGRTSGTV
jgi:Arc/MetJ-type ribon-helix-helix transcriptional regulator